MPIASRARLLARRARAAPRPVPPAESDLLAALRAFEPAHYPDAPGPVLGEMAARLKAEDSDAIYAAASPEWQAYWHKAAEAERPHLLLHYAAHWGVRPALDRLGLVAEQPPESVHAMARGPRAAAGGTWFADLVVDAALHAGLEMGEGSRVLDFGCSSGRVLRVLSAWRPEVSWLGCDPNEAATTWADEHLPGVHAFASPQEPPLPLEDATLDAAYAISVWSHFGESQARRWLGEMERVIRPRGCLIITTQGFASVSHYLKTEAIPLPDVGVAARALHAGGHAYFTAFDAGGDWGVAHPEWGMGYMSSEWLLTATREAWTLDSLQPARIDRNQDLVVLVRR